MLVEGGPIRTVPGALFHRPEFFELHRGDSGCFFTWVGAGAVRAAVHFTDVGDGVWRSPARGTFAGLAWAGDLGPTELSAFAAAVEQQLVERGARRLEVLPPPMAHDPERFALATYVLHAQGWTVSTCDLNSSLLVDGRPLEERMSRGNAKRLRKCRREGLVAERLPQEALPQVHATLAANRAANDRVLSMDLAQLEQMRAALPEAMVLFGCRDGDVLAAAALCLRLDEQVLYVFYWGHLPSHGALSPVVLLADEIHRYCQREGFRLLDLGTSTTGAVPDPGLLRFKRGLGCTESLKVRMRKDVG